MQQKKKNFVTCIIIIIIIYTINYDFWFIQFRQFMRNDLKKSSLQLVIGT